MTAVAANARPGRRRAKAPPAPFRIAVDSREQRGWTFGPGRSAAERLCVWWLSRFDADVREGKRSAPEWIAESTGLP